MTGSLFRQDAAYRRGLVLGLTMAEIIVLVIFSLLLILSAITALKDKEIKELKRESMARSEENNQLKEKVNLLLGSDQSLANKFDDLFKELEIAKRDAVEAAELKEEVIALKEQKEKFEQLKEVLDKFRMPIENPYELEPVLKQALAAKSALEKITQQIIEKGGGAKSIDEVIKTFEEYQTLEHEVKNLKGQMKNIRERLVAMGKGTEMPACWADPVTGKSEYIFDVALTSHGLIVCDRKLETRKKEQSKLPIAGITFDKEISSKQFLEECRPIYQWSKDHECRFFVSVYDLTKQDEKERYQLITRVLEQRFYKYEVLNGSFPFPDMAQAIEPIVGYSND